VTRKIPLGLLRPEATVLALASPLAAAGGRSSATDNVPATARSSGCNLVRRAVMVNSSLPDLFLVLVLLRNRVPVKSATSKS
jgi:hypothetical protein